MKILCLLGSPKKIKQFNYRKKIRACGVRQAGDIENHQDILKSAEEIARKVCSD